MDNKLDRVVTKLKLGTKATVTIGLGVQRARARVTAKRNSNALIQSNPKTTRQQVRRHLVLKAKQAKTVFAISSHKAKDPTKSLDWRNFLGA